MYAVVVEYYGGYGAIVPLGNAGLQKLRNKTRKGWLRETETLRRNTAGTVYVINDFTQAMCEMSQRQLANYVMTHATETL